MNKINKRGNKTEISIRGWDWTEIGKILGYNIDNNINEHSVNANIRKKLRKIHRILCISNDQKEISDAKLKVNQIRHFITKLCENNNSYITPLYQGLNKIEEDSEFIRFVDVLLLYLWD
jgi:hypothetical protein